MLELNDMPHSGDGSRLCMLNVNLKGVFATQVMVQHLMETKRTGKSSTSVRCMKNYRFLISLLTAPAKVG